MITWLLWGLFCIGLYVGLLCACGLVLGVGLGFRLCGEFVAVLAGLFGVVFDWLLRFGLGWFWCCSYVYLLIVDLPLGWALFSDCVVLM